MAVKVVSWNRVEFPISYDLINPTATGPKLLFLHGWGARKELMEIFQSEFQGYRQLYLDLPGFGRSGLPVPLDSIGYSAVVRVFLGAVGFIPDGIVGHSFGGKIGLLLTPPKLILLASAGLPLPKPWPVKLKIYIFKGLKRLGLGRLRNLFVSPDGRGLFPELYETFKQVVNEDFSEKFATYSGKPLLFGGEEDRIVPPEIVRRQGELLGVKPIFLPGDHFFFVQEENRRRIGEEVRGLFK
ncbi:MAG: alpha/beta hydrolase [Campylobacterales bacterium]